MPVPFIEVPISNVLLRRPLEACESWFSAAGAYNLSDEKGCGGSLETGSFWNLSHAPLGSPRAE